MFPKPSQEELDDYELEIVKAEEEEELGAYEQDLWQSIQYMVLVVIFTSPVAVRATQCARARVCECLFTPCLTQCSVVCVLRYASTTHIGM